MAKAKTKKEHYDKLMQRWRWSQRQRGATDIPMACCVYLLLVIALTILKIIW